MRSRRNAAGELLIYCAGGPPADDSDYGWHTFAEIEAVLAEQSAVAAEPRVFAPHQIGQIWAKIRARDAAPAASKSTDKRQPNAKGPAVAGSLNADEIWSRYNAKPGAK